MIKKRILSLILTCVIFVLLPLGGYTPVYATSINSYYENRNREIDDLYEKRLNLCHDYEKNMQEIQEIDLALKNLGVETLTNVEVARIMNNSKKINTNNTIQPLVEIPTSGALWTSTRSIIVYRGIQYEIQELRAMYNPATGAMSGADSIALKKAYGVTAGVKNIFKSNIGTIADKVPKLGHILATSLTVYDSLAAFCEGMTPSTIVTEIQASYTTSKVSEYIFTFVKHAGSLDTTQIECYRGNLTSVAIATNVPIVRYNSDGYKAGINVTQFDYDIVSDLYKSGRFDFAVKYYYNYKNNLPNGIYNYSIGFEDVILLDGSTRRISLPYAY